VTRLAPALRRRIGLATAAALAAAAVVGGGTTAAQAATCPAAGGSSIPNAAAPGAAQFVAYGRGYGHNLGMSQYGAEGAAKLGCSAAQILSTYYAGTHLASPTLQPNVMLVLLNTDLHGNATVTAQSGSIKWVSVTTNLTFVQPLGTTWTVVRAAVGESLKDDTGKILTTTGDNGELRALEAAQNNGINVARVRTFGGSAGTTLATDLQLKWDYTRFVSGTGGMKVWQVLTPTGAVTGIQKYLWGLAEVPVTWPDAALQAQAIAGRTYLVNGYWSASSGAYVIGTTPASQNYTGYAKEVQDAQYGSHWYNAVNATIGQVVVDASGAPILAAYTSSHGGRSEDARYVWGGSGEPYLTPVDDSTWDLASDNPNRSWAKGFSRAQLASALGMTTVTSVTVGAPFSSARLAGVHVTGLIGSTPTSATYTGATMRSLLGTLSPSMTYAWLNPDLVAPVAHATAGPGATFRWSATDAAPSSGLAPYTVTIQHGATVDYTGSTTSTAMTMVGTPGTTYQLTVVANDNAGHASTPVTASVSVPLPGTYHAVAPKRVVDSRIGLGFHGPLAAKASATVAVAGAAGSPVPAGATAVVVNVTVTGPTLPGFLTVGASASLSTSNLNFAAHETVAALVMAQLSPTGTLTVSNGSTGGAQVVADVQGYYTGDASGGTYVPVTTVRLVDTRHGTTGPVAAHGSAIVQVTGAAGIPAGATAVVANVTAVTPAKAGFLSVGGTLTTGTSTVNFAAGQTIANLAVSPLSATGAMTIYNGGTTATNVVVDVQGYFTTDATGASFNPVGQARLLDTRVSGGPLASLASRTISVAGVTGSAVPSTASAAVLSVTAVSPTEAGFLSVQPVASTATSNVNFAAHGTVANLVVAQLSATGTVTVTNSSPGSTNVVVDVLGYLSH
jgi:SpoIID/LytB domain protein